MSRTGRDRLLDFGAVAVSLAFGVIALADSWERHSPAMRVVDIALGVACAAALLWRRRHPFGIAVAILAVSTFSAFAAGTSLVVIFSAAVRLPLRRLVPVVVLGIVTAALAPLVYPPESGYDEEGLLVGSLATGLVVAWGLYARARHQLVLSLQERAARLEAEGREREERAREAERRRIAREMHDVLAHRVSLLSVHAGALEFRPDAPADEIAAAAGVIRASARSALDELRSVVGLLRADGGTEPPQPTLADLPALLDESRAAGMRVEASIALPADAPPPVALGRTVYRIVQEGLTNARKHAPGARVTVDVARAGEELVVEVVSRRAVTAAAAAGAPASSPGTGTGLVGLAERVQLAGGTLETGPDAGGDFRVRAALGWPA